MAPIFLETAGCTCEVGPFLHPGVNANCPIHGNRYKPNPRLATNSWVQPYLSQQTETAQGR